MAESDWTKNRVPDVVPTLNLVQEFKDHIDDAQDESPLQVFLAANPLLLRPLLPEGQQCWCFDRPRFGGEYIPDFLLCVRNSAGYHWVLVELESPKKPVLNRNGRRSSALSEALGQVDDWRSWLRQNIAYAQGELTFTEIDAEGRAVIVIGRRADLQPQHEKRYRELSNGRTSVMSYDRLLDSARVPAASAGMPMP